MSKNPVVDRARRLFPQATIVEHGTTLYMTLGGTLIRLSLRRANFICQELEQAVWQARRLQTRQR